jgi:NitT/TauT family transport system substrate-binding protein
MRQRVVWFLCLMGLVVGGWEVASRCLPELRFVLPTPSSIVRAVLERPDRFAHHTWCTVREMLGAMVLGFAAAFPLAWLMLSWRAARATVQPLMVLLQAVPMFALAPIMVLWFGWSYLAVVVPTALMILFPVTISIYQGLRSTPAALVDLFRIYGAAPWRVFWQARLPWAFPHILSGLRIAGGIAAVGAVAGEWAGAQEGLGVFMLESRRGSDLISTFGALFCLASISLVLYGMTAVAERALKWRPRRWMPLLSCLLVMLCSCTNRRHEGLIRLLLDWFPNPNHVALFVAVEEGYFAHEGLNIELQKLRDPADTIPYLTSGQCDLAIYYTPYTLQAMGHGADVRVVGFLFHEPLEALILRTDLETRRIGYSLAGIHLDAVQRQLQPEALINVSFDVVGCLAMGRIDATTGGYWNIEGSQLTALGIPWRHIPITEFGVPPYDELVVLSRPNFAQTEPFKRALQRAIDWSMAHPEEAFEVYRKANPDKSRKTLAWERNAWLITYPHLARDQTLDLAKWRRYADWLHEQELVAAPLEVAILSD